MEAVEGRTLLSAALWDDGQSMLGDEVVPAPVVALQKLPAPSTPARFAPAVVVKGVQYPAITGTWVGTCKISTNRTQQPCTITITRQRNGSATGVFSGAFSAGAAAVSTALVGNDHSVRVIIQGKGIYGAITATVYGTKHTQIIGRWSCNSRSGWQSGTLVLDRKA